MQEHGYTILHADQHWVADMMQALDEAATEKLMVLYDALIELDDVQSVFTNADLGQTFID
jgi:transcriptional/translational regulatory protein YebC/TACO1